MSFLNFQRFRLLSTTRKRQLQVKVFRKKLSKLRKMKMKKAAETGELRKEFVESIAAAEANIMEARLEMEELELARSHLLDLSAMEDFLLEITLFAPSDDD